MKAELALKRPAEIVEHRPPGPQYHLIANARPVVPTRPTALQRVLTPADWPWSVVIALHVALAGAVVTPFVLLAMYMGS